MHVDEGGLEVRGMNELTALALEYQRDYGTAHRNVDISDFVNNPFVNSPSSVLGLGFKEKIGDLISGKFAVLGDDRADTVLVTQ